MRELTHLLSILLIFLGLNSFSQSTEDFLTESNGSTTFTDNGQSFTISTYNSTTKQFDINQSFPGTGWNGSANDNGYIDNDQNVYASPSFGIETSDGTNFWLKNSTYILLIVEPPWEFQVLYKWKERKMALKSS